MFEEIMQRIELLGDVIRGELADEVKAEIHAATIKHMTTLLLIARADREARLESEREAILRDSARLALQIDAEVERQLEESD